MTSEKDAQETLKALKRRFKIYSKDALKDAQKAPAMYPSIGT